MASNLTSGSSVSLGISALKSQQLEANKNTAERSDASYRPGDIIPAVIEVHRHKSFEALKLHGSLIGAPTSLQPSTITTRINDKLTSLPPRRNKSMDPPFQPRRRLPNHHPHPPQPERRLLAISTINQHNQSGKQTLNTHDVRPSRTRDRIRE
jgi:hypothetical protein